jgi:hypothetical protein
MRARRLSSRCMLLALVAGVAVLGSPPSRAADPAQRIVRVGFVIPNSPSIAARGVSAFWERLRDLGWDPENR